MEWRCHFQSFEVIEIQRLNFFALFNDFLNEQTFRDPKWNINEYIKNIFNEYKVWSSTYWRLWSQCHFLYCYMCCTMYAVAFSDCCPYHPQQPHFYPVEQFQTTNSPIGKLGLCLLNLF